MGTFYSNCQVWSDSQEAVVAALTHLLNEPAYVAPAVKGWVGVYPEGSRTDSAKLAKRLSSRLTCGVLSLTVHDSDIFSYSLYENGKRRDDFNSSPDYFESVSSAEKARLRGKPEALLPYCLPGVSGSQVQEVLHPAQASEAAKKSITFSAASDDEYLFAEVQAAGLTQLMGMDQTLAALGHRYIETGETRDYTLDQFLLIKTSALKGKAASSLTRIPPSARKLDTYANHIDERGEPLLVSVARLCLTESVQELVDGGAEVNIMTKPSYASIETGITALIAAAGASIDHPTRQLETVRLLLDAGADVTARSETGRTPLSEALRMTNPTQHTGKIRYLAPKDVLQRAAARSAQVVEMLRAAGATE